jgi:hypothetical protein
MLTREVLVLSFTAERLASSYLEPVDSISKTQHWAYCMCRLLQALVCPQDNVEFVFKDADVDHLRCHIR